jgi:DNA uptake protein ComE-like DNA-binding protein
MNLQQLKTYFIFNKGQRTGIILLLSLMVLFQISFYFIDFSQPETNPPEKQQWLSLQTQIDSVKKIKGEYEPTIYPFNPNFITDFKGYKLGMTTQEIDRLLAFRKLGKFANSVSEFQKVTKVSDSLLATMSPYFKFPDWLNKKNIESKSGWVDYSKTNAEIKAKEKLVVIDINQATQENLEKVYMIGPAIAERILKEKEKYGAFVSMEQMADVWGLSPEVIENLNKSFKVLAQPDIKKIDVNNASLKELMQFPMFRYNLAKNIITYRTMNGDIKIEDLTKIKEFPVDKVKIIALYLQF